MTLTMALALVAGLVLLAIGAHAAWTLHRTSPRRAQPEPPVARVEPGMGTPMPESAAVPRAVDSGEAPPKPVLRRTARLDPLIDAIAPLTLEAPVSGEMLLSHLPPTRRAGTKPFHIEALNAETGEWEPPAAGQRYGELQAGVQLANRHGALNEIEYSEFVQKVQGFAEGTGAMADFPDMLDVVARARELDAFASPHDANLTVLLRSDSVAWSVGYVQQCAARQGFVAGVLPGRLVLPSPEEGAPALLLLSFDPQAAFAGDAAGAALRELTLSLDVPQTPESAEPFALWQQAARALADDMGATLIDDDGRPITLHAFAAIGQALKGLYSALEARDLAAGSAAARRLFS